MKKTVSASIRVEKRRVRMSFLGLGLLLLFLMWLNLRNGIVLSIRLPRMLAAAMLGGALSVSGFLLQTYFANPIAGPYVLGVSSGAKLTVALSMVICLEKGILLSSAAMIGSAFAGAMLSMAFLLLASRKLRGVGMLIVCGVMIGYVCSAVTELVVAFADDSQIVNLHNWSMGSFAGISRADLLPTAISVFPALGAAFLLSKPMEAWQLGEAYAGSVGVRIRFFRTALILVSGLLSAVVTAFAGPISFVGIAVPHLMKRLLHSAKPKRMIPACFLGGGCFCLLCDLLARTLFSPMELSISTVTAIFGAPVVIVMLLERKGGRAL